MNSLTMNSPILPKALTATLLIFLTCISIPMLHAQSGAPPEELEILKKSIGTWDAVIEVWPSGLDGDSITFKGVEKSRGFGDYWIASDFDSEFGGQVNRIHSIIGYDLDEKKLVGKIIDQGPYMARMTGQYDKKTNTIHWTTKVKDPSGNPLVQKTSVTQQSDDKRLLVLSIPVSGSDKFIKFMEIRYTRQIKKESK